MEVIILDSKNEDKESFTYDHSDIKKNLENVIESVQYVRDVGVAIFDRALDWYSEEDQVKTLDTITSNTKMLSKIDGLCNYISIQIDNDPLWAYPSKMDKLKEMHTSDLIKEYKKVTDSLKKEILKLEAVTTLLNPKIESEKSLYSFVLSDIKDCSNVIYTSLNSIEKNYDLNNIRKSLSLGEEVQPRPVGAFIPRK